MGACTTKAANKKKPLEPDCQDPLPQQEPNQQQAPPPPGTAAVLSNQAPINIQPSSSVQQSEKNLLSSNPAGKSQEASPLKKELAESNQPTGNIIIAASADNNNNNSNSNSNNNNNINAQDEALADLHPIKLNLDPNSQIAPILTNSNNLHNSQTSLKQSASGSALGEPTLHVRSEVDPLPSEPARKEDDNIQLNSGSRVSFKQDLLPSGIEQIESNAQTIGGVNHPTASSQTAAILIEESTTNKKGSSAHCLEQEHEEEEDEGKKGRTHRMKPTIVSIDQQSMTQFTGLMNDYVSKKDDNQTSETATATNMQLTRGKKSAVVSTHESGIVLKVLSPTQESFAEVEEDGIHEIPDALEEDDDDFNNEENLTEENTESIRQKNFHLEQVGEGIMTNMIMNLDKRNPLDQASQIVAVGY